MNLLESVRITWRNIREHKLRSTLTTLGIILGVAAVITFVTLGASLQADIINTVAGGNAGTMYIAATGSAEQGLPSLGGGGEAVFTEHDIDRLREIDGISTVVPESGLAASQISYQNDSVGRQWVTVSSEDYFRVRGQEFITGQTYRMGQREVVLNQPATRMFQGGNVSVGDEITITRAANGQELDATVVGIVRPQQDATESLFGGEGGSQPVIYAPTDPYYQRTALSPSQNEQQRVFGRVIALAEDPEQVDVVQGRIYTYLGEESDARVLKSRNYEFEVTTHEQLINQIKQVSNTFTAYITGIALISLIVGSIGIANIMLVSVTERTNEIGIMKAVGAQNRDVLQLFLLEAIMLGVLGSALGAIVGTIAAYAATEVIELPLAFRPEWFVASIAVGILVGVVAGLYPAWDAARTDPIDALRHE